MVAAEIAFSAKGAAGDRMTPLSHAARVSHILFIKAQDRCQKPPSNSLQSSYKVESTTRYKKNFPGLLNSNLIAGSDVNECDVVIMETERGINSSPAVMQPFGAMVSGGYRAQSWRVTGVVHASFLNSDCHVAAGCTCNVRVSFGQGDF